MELNLRNKENSNYKQHDVECIYKARENHKLVLRKNKLQETLNSLKANKTKTPNTIYTINEVTNSLFALASSFDEKDMTNDKNNNLQLKYSEILDLCKDKYEVSNNLNFLNYFIFILIRLKMKL